MTIFIDFPCNGGAKIGNMPGYYDVLEDHYATCRTCRNEEEQDHADSLHAHRTAEEINARCEYFRQSTDRSASRKTRTTNRPIPRHSHDDQEETNDPTRHAPHHEAGSRAVAVIRAAREPAS